MIVFFLAKKEIYWYPNAVEKHRTGAFRTRNQTLSFFFSLKNRQSLWKWELYLLWLVIAFTVFYKSWIYCHAMWTNKSSIWIILHRNLSLGSCLCCLTRPGWEARLLQCLSGLSTWLQGPPLHCIKQPAKSHAHVCMYIAYVCVCIYIYIYTHTYTHICK